MLKVVVASDSFKGSLTSAEVAGNIEKGIRNVCPDCNVVRVSVADGGEGTVEALRESLGGILVECYVNDPIGRVIPASYSIVDKGTTAVIEMSAASGLPLLTPDERNPMETSTFGTGELIADALSRGCRKFLVGIGGSATNDAGMGMLEALGWRFLDADGNILEGCGRSLDKVASIDMSAVNPAVKESEFVVACDVDTPFCGPEGAAYVFAPQKGASEEMVVDLDRGMNNFARVVSSFFRRNFVDVPGTGAAGGLGGAFLVFLDSVLKPGVEMVLDAVGFDDIVRDADLVFTGEGRIDFQTLKGKTPFGVMKYASRHSVPVYALGGCVSLDGVDGFDMIPRCDVSADSDGGSCTGVPGDIACSGAMRGGGFELIVPAVTGEYDLEYVMRPDIAALIVNNAACSMMYYFMKKRFGYNE